MERKEVEVNVLNWAKDKDLLKSGNAKNQVLKTMSELGELTDEILKGNREAIIDELGDVEVCLTILKAQLSITQDDPLKKAYTKIKDRTGKTVDGTFIKD